MLGGLDWDPPVSVDNRERAEQAKLHRDSSPGSVTCDDVLRFRVGGPGRWPRDRIGALQGQTAAPIKSGLGPAVAPAGRCRLASVVAAAGLEVRPTSGPSASTTAA